MKKMLKLTKEDWKGYWNVTKFGIVISFFLSVILIGTGWFLLRNKDKEDEEEDPE